MLRVAIDAREVRDRYGGWSVRTGIGRYLANLLEGLAARGNVIDGEEVVPILLGRSAFFDLGEALRRSGACVFYTPYYKLPLYHPLPSIVTVHDLIPEKTPAPGRWWFAARLRHALARADRIATVSETTAAHLRARGVGEDRLVLSKNAVAARFVPEVAPDDDAVLARHGLTRGGYALAAIDARPHKNLAGLLAAWARVAGERADFVLAVTAEAAPSPEAPVKFLGRVGEEEIAVLYRGARFVVHPAFDEGFGLPVLEAMACGTPVAAARAGAIPEVAGEAAEYFDPADSEEIARAIERLLADDARRAELRAKGLARAAEARPAERSLPLWRAVVELGRPR